MMQWWTSDAVRFMRDASEYGDHYARLSNYLMRWLPADGHLCDAGCGLGYLAQALADHCRYVTAIDRSEAAIAAMRARRLPENLETICGDAFQLLPERPFDAMTFCYFGSSEEILRLARCRCNGSVVMVKRDCSEHRFSVHPGRTHRDVRAAAEDLLERNGIPFHSERLALEFGQPFRTPEDAMAFFRLYNPQAEVNENWVADRLTKTGRTDFPLYLPEMRKMAVLVLQAKDIPEELK